jgi:hypothetical protein
MNENAVLYALSTLAQTCAALAAFVGAVGIFRLQALRDGRRQADHELRLQMIRHISINEAEAMPSSALRPAIEHLRATMRPLPPRLPDVDAAEARWTAFNPLLASSRIALFIFEAWNLLVIGVSVVGFNYVPVLMFTPWAFWSLWAAAVGTVGVTGYCVYAWTRG